jgi:hypothetical protein
MIKKRFYRKAQQAMPYQFLIKILAIIVIAGILYLMIRGIGNAFTPK